MLFQIKNSYILNVSAIIKVSTMDKYHVNEKNSPVGFTFFGVEFDPAGLSIEFFKSLTAIIGIHFPGTKLCPFCEETLKKEACSCRFCNRILMKEINFKTKR